MALNIYTELTSTLSIAVLNPGMSILLCLASHIKLLLQLSSHGTVLAVERQSWCGTTPKSRVSCEFCMMHLVTQQRAVT